MHASLKRNIPVVGVAILALAVASGCAAPPNKAKGSATNGTLSATAVGGGASLSYTVPQLMSSLKLDQANGINVDYKGAGTSSTNMIAAVMSGEADFAFPATTTALDAIKNGSDLVIVAAGLKSASIVGLRKDVVTKVGVAANAPIDQRIQALKGLTIATSPEGSGNNTMLRAILSGAGLDPDKDVKVIGVQDPSAIVGGIKQRQFDGGFYGSGVIEANIAAGEAELWVSTATGEVSKYIGDQVGMVLVTRGSTLKSKPDLVKAMFKAVVATEAAIAEKPQEVGPQLKQNWFPKLDQKVFDLAWAEAQHAYPTDGAVPKAGFDKLIELMSKGGKPIHLNYDSVVYEQARK